MIEMMVTCFRMKLNVTNLNKMLCILVTVPKDIREPVFTKYRYIFPLMLMIYSN